MSYTPFFLNYNLPLNSYFTTLINIFYVLTDYTSLIYTIAINISLVLTSYLPFYNLTTIIFNNNSNIVAFNFNKIFNPHLEEVNLIDSTISDIYNDLDLIDTFNTEVFSTNLSFESSFYRAFLYNVDIERPLFGVEPLLKINPYFYRKIKKNDYIRYESFNTYYKYLPLNTTKVNVKNPSSYFYINNLDFKKINFLSKTPELLNFNTNLSDQLSLINSLR
jgi:hypothetical protein